MKRLTFFSILISLLVISFTSSAQTPREAIKGDFLLNTQCGSNMHSIKFTPDNSNLGCHSIAIAQILNYYRLQPAGTVSYVCSNGTQIDEDFSNYRAHWDLMADKLSASSSQEEIDATAHFLYITSVIAQKDFGTNRIADPVHHM